MKMIAALLLSLVATAAAQQFPGAYIEASQVDLSSLNGQRSAFLFSTLTITVSTSTTTTISAATSTTTFTTVSTVTTTSSTCTVTTTSVCSGKRRRRGILFNEQEPQVDYLGVAVTRQAAAPVAPSAVESVEADDANAAAVESAVESAREQRSAQFNPYLGAIQPSYNPFQGGYRRLQSPYFRDGVFGAVDSSPNVLYAPDQRWLLTFSTSTSTVSTTTFTSTATVTATITSFTSTATSTVSITPLCSTTSSFATCASG